MEGNVGRRRLGSQGGSAAIGVRDAEVLARVIRRRAMEAHEIVNCPNARVGELIKVHRHFEELL
jgi:hypothetical protein